jgi:Low temperature viability protein
LVRKGFVPIDLSIDDEEIESDEDNDGMVAYNGYDNRHLEYDYTQHLKEMGNEGAKFISATYVRTKELTNQGIVFKDEDAKSQLDHATKPLALPSDLFGGRESDVGLLSQPAHEFEGLGLEMTDELREIMAALDDEAYIEPEEDLYFDCLNSDTVPTALVPLVKAGEEMKKKEEEGWMGGFNKFRTTRTSI